MRAYVEEYVLERESQWDEQTEQEYLEWCWAVEVKEHNQRMRRIKKMRLDQGE